MDPNRRTAVMLKSSKFRVCTDSEAARWQLVARRGIL